MKKKKSDSPPAHQSAPAPRQPLGFAQQSGVRDPRLLQVPEALLVDPRKAPNRDLLALQRRIFWMKQARPNEAQPWVGGAESKNKGDVEKKFTEQLNAPLNDERGGSLEAYANGARKAIESAQRAAVESDKAATLTMLQYRYTKGGEIVNDEMGYGEKIEDVLWRPHGDRLIERVRTSQRTKSGRQRLGPDDASR